MKEVHSESEEKDTGCTDMKEHHRNSNWKKLFFHNKKGSSGLVLG